MTRVMISCPPAVATAGQFVPRLEDAGLEVVLADVVQQLSESDLLPLVGDLDGIIAGDDQLTARVLEAAPRLRVIVRWGIGMDNVDLAGAQRLGIRVVNTPGVFGDEVADVAIGYLILLARQLHRIDAGVRAGDWPKPRGRTLAGMRMAIVGLGSIGRSVARRATALGMTVAGSDPLAAARAAAADEGVRVADFHAVIGDCDVLVLCSPLTAATHHLIDARALAQMMPGSWLINVSRGDLVDERALADALGSGQLAGAALDVFEHEPLPPDSPLRAMDSVILGSHNASNTADAVARVNDLACDLLVRGLAEVSR